MKDSQYYLHVQNSVESYPVCDIKGIGCMNTEDLALLIPFGASRGSSESLQREGPAVLLTSLSGGLSLQIHRVTGA